MEKIIRQALKGVNQFLAHIDDFRFYISWEYVSYSKPHILDCICVRVVHIKILWDEDPKLDLYPGDRYENYEWEFFVQVAAPQVRVHINEKLQKYLGQCYYEVMVI